ncbi:tyrosine-type recombinase/integrase [Thermodesulfobacteriota bacterium]
MKLSTCLHQFFDQYLQRMQGRSPQTLKAYRDTFSRFLPFAAQYHRIKIDSLCLEHLCPELVLAFLDHLESQHHNTVRTRNLRLAALKSFAKMIRLLCPDQQQVAESILSIPQKRMQKKLMGFLYPEEILKVFEVVDLKEKDGLRDYCLLHLLFDSGARASEAASLQLDYFDYEHKSLCILGKASRFRMLQLWPITADLVNLYISSYRKQPRPLYRQYLFINQRGEAFTRHGINRLCKKYLSRTLEPKRTGQLNPAHCFRHSCAVNMLRSGFGLSDIKNHLGHEHVQSTMTYLHMDLSGRREVQKTFVKYTRSILGRNPKIDELIDWQNKQETLKWLDTL